MLETGNAILDTSVLIAHFDQDSSVSDSMASVERLHLPVIVLGELYCGVHRVSNPDKILAQIEGLLPGVHILNLTPETADWYGRIHAVLRRAGTPIPTNDIWIAALAREYDWPVATRDEHFKRIDSLAVLGW